VIDTMPADGGTGADDDGFSPVRCWQHALAVAVLCERLAATSVQCPPSVAYLVGLCHDLGKILVRTAFAAEFKQVIEAQRRTGMRRDQVERAMLGVSHHEVVSIILRKLALPDSIRRPIEAMAHPSQRSTDPAARILSLANGYANGLMLCESIGARVAPVTAADLKAAAGADQVPVLDVLGFRGEIVALTAVLARLSAAQERELTRPLLAPTDKKVWLTREKGLSAFDPIGALLSGLADVRIEPRLPTPDEAAEVDRIVVTARATSCPGLGAADVEKASGAKGSGGVLWLVGREDLPTASGAAVRPRPWTVTLQEVADFLGGAA
jgi:hypothetical protein